MLISTSSIRPPARLARQVADALSDRVIAALASQVLSSYERIEDTRSWPGEVGFRTARGTYHAQPEDWLVTAESWVRGLFRVVVDRWTDHLPVSVYGLLFDRDDNAFFLNDVRTMKELGRRLGVDLEPLAYAEILAELYSGREVCGSDPLSRDVEGPVVAAMAVTASSRSGWLVEYPDETLLTFPWIASNILAPPVVERTGGGVRLQFYSCYYHLADDGEVDVLRWTVLGGAGREVSWTREYVVRGLERPRVTRKE